MAAFTTTDLITSIRGRGAIPSSNTASNNNSDVGLLRIASEELLIKLLPMLLSTRSEFYAYIKDYAITINQADYEIPSRASGMVLRDVQVVDGTSISSLSSIDSEHLSTTSSGTPVGFYLKHNQVVLYPTPSSTSGTLRLRYFLRPSKLVRPSDAAQVSAINAATSAVTVTSIPAGFTTAFTYDLIKKSVPYAPLAIDQTPVSVVSTVITFSSLPSGLAVGDWIAFSDETPIPQIPQEFQAVLAQMTAVKYLEAAGDREGSAAAWKNLQQDMDSALKMITPRVVGERKIVRSRNWSR